MPREQKIPFTRLLSKKQFLAVGAFFALVFALLLYVFFSPNHFKTKSPHLIVINKGDSFFYLPKRLKDEGIIPRELPLKIAAFLLGGAERIIPGRYRIPDGISYIRLAEMLVRGEGDKQVLAIIPDGASTESIAKRLAALNICQRDSFYSYYRSLGITDKYKIKGDSLIGYLMPGTYTFYERSSPDEIIDTLLRSFELFFDSDKEKLSANLGLTKWQVTTLASIVNGETKKESEMPAIASVYLNRLRTGMKLQADPTLQFVRGGAWGRVDSQLLKKESKYNTYKYTGLPPGPINNPGKPAINAVLFAVQSNYLFFVADGTGGHSFSKNYAEHKKKAAEYIKRVYGKAGKK